MVVIRRDIKQKGLYKKKVLCIVILLFIISATGFFIMWFTNMYNNSILKNLVLANNTVAVEWWKVPPLNPHLKIHVFNYTNADRYMLGEDKKLIVKDLGPYVYVETFEKVNVRHNENYTISYQEKRSYQFSPELSAGKQYDQVTVPNIPMLTYSSILPSQPMFMKFAANAFLSTKNSKPFKTVSADEIVWGYEDPLIQFKNMFSADASNPGNKFGMFLTRNGVSKDVITIFTGEDDIEKLSIIDRFNGRTNTGLWPTDECDSIHATDGSQFPPHLMDKVTPLEVYLKAFCRKLQLVYDSEVNIFDGIPAWRYKSPLNLFAHPDNNTANQCFCHMNSGTCAPSGVYNATRCFENAPIFISFPHFLTGDQELFKYIDGLNPNEEEHLSYADIHPRLAFPIGGASRFQINIQVKKDGYISDLKKFHNGQILPVIWMEFMSGEISQELRKTIYHSTFSANAIQLSLRYGSLLLCATTLGMLIAAFYYRNRNASEKLTKATVALTAASNTEEKLFVEN